MKNNIIDKPYPTLDIPQDISMSITTLPGAKIRFIGCCQEAVNWGGCDDPNVLFSPGQILTIKEIEIHSWYTKVYIEGYEGAFPSVAFQNIAE